MDGFMLDWFTNDILPHFHWDSLFWIGSIFLVTYGTSFGLLSFVLLRLPVTYFCQPATLTQDDNPRWLLRLARNLVAGVLLLLGGIMTLPVVPGPGFLTLLLGLLLADVRGKRPAELWLVGRPGVLTSINRLRNWLHKGPFLGTEDLR
jgi:hypothetical protein